MLVQSVTEILDPLFQLTDGGGSGSLLVAGGFFSLLVFAYGEPDSARANERGYGEWHSLMDLHSLRAANQAPFG